jgi:hypothetical protein
MAKRKIVLLARAGEVLQTEDAAAGAAITPGMLVIRNSSGLWIPHGTAAGTLAPPDFAMERDEMGKDMDTPYATGDRVKVAHLCPGERVNALLETGANVAIGAALESNGAGALQAATTGKVVAIALEAVNNATGANVRIRVQIV